MASFSIIRLECVTRNEILQNEIIGTQISFSTNFNGKLNFNLSIFLGASTVATYIFIVPTYTTIVITPKPCAFNKISSLCRYH
jgi:hypothetical protein